MEIRYFQIIIPLFSLFLILRQLLVYRKSESNKFETMLISLFWGGILIFSLFPDFFSNLIAKIFGIKSNINAVIFFALGLLFYFQLQLYKMIKKQDDVLTEIARKIALDNAEKKK